MSFVTISPNMGLPVPDVGQEPGPAWAQDVNSCMGILDQHNHTSGQGVPITPAGMNINTDLTMNGNNLISVNTVRFNSLSSPLSGTAPNLGCIYDVLGELYWNDGSGNQVQITKAGSINATSSGIVSGTASASFAGGVLVVDQATNTPGNIQVGSVLMGNNVAGSNFLTWQPPNAMGSSYSVTAPPPNTSGSIVFLTYDTANNIGLGVPVATLSPSGMISMYGGTSAPTGWLICDGTAYDRTVYSDLFTAIGTAYGIGDGSTTFNVPDFRGLFPRGVDNGAGNDPDASSRTAINGGNSGDNVGSYQSNQNLSHSHSDAGHQHGETEGVSFGNAGTGFASTGSQNLPNLNTYTGYANIQASGGNQSNPNNLYVNFIIKT